MVDLYGSTETVAIISSSKPHCSPSQESLHSSRLQDSLEMLDAKTPSKEGTCTLEFHENHGRNIQLSNENQSARRIASYNQGVVVSARPLPRGQLFQVRSHD